MISRNSIIHKVGLAAPLIALLLMLCLPVHTGLAASAASNVDGAIYTRVTTGIIREIDLNAREAIISGFRYYFGHTQYNNGATIKMFQSQAGSFEMLTVDMKVEMVYAEYGHLRYVLSLQQLDPLTLDVEG